MRNEEEPTMNNISPHTNLTERPLITANGQHKMEFSHLIKDTTSLQFSLCASADYRLMSSLAENCHTPLTWKYYKAS